MSADIIKRDSNADKAIASMIATTVGAAAVPAHVNWALMASILGGGVVAIGLCYDVKLSKDEAWKLVKQFFIAAGSFFIGINISSKIFAMILTSTGIGHIGAVALDAALSSAIAYAIGATAKHYFRNDYLGKDKLSKAELGNIFRDAFKKKRQSDPNAPIET